MTTTLFFVRVLIATSLIFNVNVSYADSKNYVGSAPFPPIAQVGSQSKTMREFVIKMKPMLTSAQFLFLMEKIKDVEKEKPPKITETKPGSYEIRLGEINVSLVTVSAVNGTYTLNGKALNLGPLSLQDKLDLILRTIQAGKAAHNPIWNLLFPEATADLGMIIAVCALLVAATGLLINLRGTNSQQCKEVKDAAGACLILNGKLQAKVTETEKFSLAQKEFRKTEANKSAEITAKIADACKDLTNSASEIVMTMYMGDSATQNFVVWCDKDVNKLKSCLQGMETIDGSLKRFVKESCTPEATTTASPEKIVPQEESPDSPGKPITNVLQQSAKGGETLR